MAEVTERVLFTGHLNPDLDALSSMLAAMVLSYSPDPPYPLRPKGSDTKPIVYLPATYNAGVGHVLKQYATELEGLIERHISDEDLIQLCKEKGLTSLIVSDTKSVPRLKHVAALLGLTAEDEAPDLLTPLVGYVAAVDHHPGSDSDVKGERCEVITVPHGAVSSWFALELKRVLQAMEGSFSTAVKTLCGRLPVEKGASFLRFLTVSMAGAIYEDTGGFLYPTTGPTDALALAFLMELHDEALEIIQTQDNSHPKPVEPLPDILGAQGGVGRRMFSNDLKALAANIKGANKGEEKAITPLAAKILNAFSRNHEIQTVASAKISIVTCDRLEEYVPNVSELVQTFFEKNCDTQAIFALVHMGNTVSVIGRGRGEGSGDDDIVVDVGAVCQALGGGGHKAAASASAVDESIEEVRGTLYAALLSVVGTQHAEDIMTAPPLFLFSTDSVQKAATTFLHRSLKQMPVMSATMAPSIGDSDDEDDDFLMEEADDAATEQAEQIISKNPVGTVIGVVDRVDVEKAIAHGLGQRPITEVLLSRQIEVVLPTCNLATVVSMCMTDGQRLVPVVKCEDIGKQELLGVVTKSDVIKLVMQDPTKYSPKASTPRGGTSAKKYESLAKLLKQMPSGVQKMLREFGNIADRLGVRVFVVGGLVRDLLLGKQNDDIDLTVEGDGMEYAEALYNSELLQCCGIKRNPSFGSATVTVTVPGRGFDREQNPLMKIDVATARLEYYPMPAALPVVSLSSIKMDLYRRDFTINAMAVQINTAEFGRLMDYFQGKQDLQSPGKIRCLHSLSFIDDPTRIMRAVRFAARYQYEIGIQTKRLLRQAVARGYWKLLSGDRRFNEIEHLFSETEAVCRSLVLLKDTLKVMKEVFPSCSVSEKIMRWAGRIHSILHQANTPSDIAAAAPWQCYLMILYHDSGDRAYGKALSFYSRPSKLAAVRKQLKEVSKLSKALTVDDTKTLTCSQLYNALQGLSVEGLAVLLAEETSDEWKALVVDYVIRTRHKTVLANGHALMERFPILKKNKKTLAPLKDELLRAVLDGDVAEVLESQLVYAGKWLEKQSLLTE